MGMSTIKEACICQLVLENLVNSGHLCFTASF